MGYLLSSLSKTQVHVGLGISEFLLLISALVVVIGLVGEYRTPSWKIKYDLFTLLVAIGCAGELIADGGVFLFSHELEIISDAEVKDAVTKAGDAKTSADGAAKDASRAKDFADKAGVASSGAVTLAEGARKEADSFEKDILSVRKEATEAKSDVAEALRRAKEIEQRLAWRTLTPEQQDGIRSKLSAFSGIVVDIFIWGDSAEIQNITALIADSIPKPAWTLHIATPVGGAARVGDTNRLTWVRGVAVSVRPGSDEKTVGAAMTLLKSLQSTLAASLWPFERMGIPLNRTGDLAAGNAPIRVFIGSKP